MMGLRRLNAGCIWEIPVKGTAMVKRLRRLILGSVLGLILDSNSLRGTAKRIIRRFEIGGYGFRANIGVVDRPHYVHCVYNAAVLAKKLGYGRISVLEFGVGAGNGLVSLEYHSQEISKLLSIEVDIYGFDIVEGFPEPMDYRDLPFCWEKGAYKMDVSKLQARLKRAKLVLGDIRETSKDFFEKHNPAPIGAIVYDLGFYSSTAIALNMLEAGEKYYLPRVFCYFNSTTGNEMKMELYSDFTGERLAINEFNLAHRSIKNGLPYYSLPRRMLDPWLDQIWICHFLEHSRYNEFVSTKNQGAPLGPLHSST